MHLRVCAWVHAYVCVCACVYVQPLCINQSFLAPPQYRDDLGRLLESLGDFHTGMSTHRHTDTYTHTQLHGNTCPTHTRALTMTK